MLKVDHQKWQQSVSDLLDHALHEDHPRVRERYLALYLIAKGQSASHVAEEFGHFHNAVTGWCHTYNDQGPEALKPVWPGREPELTPEEFERLNQALDKPPRDSGYKQGVWTGKLVSDFVARTFGKEIQPDTGIDYLHRLNKSRKRPRKRFMKADGKAQQEFAEALVQIETMRWGHSTTAYVDEAQIWMDVRPALSWSTIGEPAEVPSFSPGKKKILYFACVMRPQGKVISQLVKVFNGETTAEFLHKLRRRLKGYRIDLVWDGAPYHKGARIQQALSELNIHEHRLPPYSPEMNAEEPLNRWAKENLSNNTPWQDLNQLKHAFNGFILSLYHRTQEVLQRCKPDMLHFQTQ